MSYIKIDKKTVKRLSKIGISTDVTGKAVVNSEKIYIYDRDDILLRIYVFSENNIKIWDEFCSSNYKVRRKKNNIYKLLKSLKKDGQRICIKVIFKRGKVYPVEGATRLAVLFFLGTSIRVKFINQKSKKIKFRSMLWEDSAHFRGISKEERKKFEEWRNEYKKIRKTNV